MAVWRASEIIIGIVCAGIVLAGTDLGGVRRRLALSFANLAAEIAGRFAGMLARRQPEAPDAQAERGELVRRVVALDPMIDQAVGESSNIHYHSPTLQAAVYGLFGALDGWRGIATHLSHRTDRVDQQSAEAILQRIPPELRSARAPGASARWMADPRALRRMCGDAVRSLLVQPSRSPSLRLLADETAKVLAGMARALEGLALLVDAPGRPLRGQPGFRMSVPDWMPALVDAGRAFVAIGAIELFWIATAWPNGGAAIAVVAIVMLLLSPKGELAFIGAIAVTLAAVASVLCAATIKFAVLPSV